MSQLVKRKGKNNYEIQVALPSKLRPILGTASIYRSTGTSDLRTAKQLFPIRLAEIQGEIAGMMTEHFPDDKDALGELKGLIEAMKHASDSVDHPDDFSEKDILLDVIADWGHKQRIKHLNSFKTRHPHKAIPEEVKRTAEQIQEKAEVFAIAELDPHLKIETVVEAWRKHAKPTLSQSTCEEYERAIKRLLEWCKERRIKHFHDMDRRKVREFVAETFHGKMGKTVKLAISGLRGVWKQAKIEGWIEERSTIWDDHDYRDNVRIGTGEVKGEDKEEAAFSFDDIRALLTQLEPHPFRDIIRLGLLVGARSSEITALKPEHVKKEDDGYWLNLPGTKTASAKRRPVPIPAAYDPFMDRLIKQQKGKWLLPFYEGREFGTDRDRNRYINKEINRKRRELGLPNSDRQGVHSTRRTYIELLEGAEVPVGTIKLLVGHKRTDITIGRYGKGQYVDLRRAAEKLEFPEDIVDLINFND